MLIDPVEAFGEGCEDLDTFVTGIVYINDHPANGTGTVRVAAYRDASIIDDPAISSNISGRYYLKTASALPETTSVSVPLALIVSNKTTNETIYSAIYMATCGANKTLDFPIPNFTVTDITFNPTAPTEGIDTVTITAAINNPESTGTLDILFYDGDTLIGYVTKEISQGQSSTAVDWIPTSSGTHTITVVPGSWDNAASNTIDVQSIYDPTQTLTYDTPGDKVVYVKIPKDDNVTFAEINLTGSAYFLDVPVNEIDKWKSSNAWDSETGAHCSIYDTYCFGYADGTKVWSTLIFNSSEIITLTQLNTHKGSAQEGCNPITIGCDICGGCSDLGSAPLYGYDLTICETNINDAANAGTANCTGAVFTLVDDGGHDTDVPTEYEPQTMQNSYLIQPDKKYLMIWQPTEPAREYAIARIIDNFSGAMIYPKNVELDVANNSVIDWNQTGVLNTTATIKDSPDFAGLLNSQLSSCNCSGCIDLETECAIPLVIHSDTRGVIDVSVYYESIPRGARLIVEPPSTTVEVNDTFIINITIAGTDIYSVEYELTFNTGVLEVEMVEEGEFLKQDGSSIFDYTITINNDTIIYVITRLNDTGGDEGGITGEGRLTWIKFRAKDEGTTDLHITNYNISNSNISEIKNVTTIDGQVEVGGEVEFIIPLYTGWNLISIPVIPENNSITAVLESIEGSYNKVIRFNGTSQESEDYIPPSLCPFCQNAFDTIDPGRGYWISAIEDANLTVYGAQSQEMSNGLSTGWNLVGWEFLIDENIPDALLSISGSYNKVIRFNGTSQQSEDYIPPSLCPFCQNAFDTIDPGRGYWISATENKNWTYSI